MTRVLLLAAVFGLSVSAAGACEYQKMVKAKVDPTVVASITQDGTAAMSTSADAVDAAGEVILKQATE